MAYSKILVAYDGSKSSDDALEQAIMLVQDYDSTRLEIIHVYQFPTFVMGEGIFSPSPTQENDIYENIQLVISKAKERVNLIPFSDTVLKYGNPAKMILEYAEESHCDLIVIGSRGHGGILGFMLGSVSHNVVQHSKVPVLVVK